MYRRNRDLERVMRELSVELESRGDTDDYEVRSGSNDIHFEEITATEIWGRTELTITKPCTHKKNRWKLRTRKEKKKEQGAGPNTALRWRWFDLNHGATRTACHCQKRENSQKVHSYFSANVHSFKSFYCNLWFLFLMVFILLKASTMTLSFPREKKKKVEEKKKF